MKTKLTYLPALFFGLVILLNSCSSTQQFAGVHYPENRIAGKGPGYGLTENKTQPAINTTNSSIATAPDNKPASVNAVVTTEAKPEAKSSIVEAIKTITAADVKGHKAPSKFETRFAKFALKYMSKHAPDINNMTASSKKGLSGLREKITAKFTNSLLKKYGYEATAGVAGAAHALSIVSFATGIVALVFSWIPWVDYFAIFVAIAAIATGVIALIGFGQGGEGHKWMALVGIILGGVALLFSIISIILYHSVLFFY